METIVNLGGPGGFMRGKGILQGTGCRGTFDAFRFASAGLRGMNCCIERGRQG